MGWDSFGLPAENAAKERGVRPNEWTQNNISQMKNLLERLKCTFDWQNELNTCSPEYYRWTQYIFLKMYDAGLVYQKEVIIGIKNLCKHLSISTSQLIFYAGCC